MMRQSHSKLGAVMVLFSLFSLAGCTLPRSAPTTSEFYSSSADDALSIIPIDQAPAMVSADAVASGFPNDFVSADAISLNTVSQGDILSVSIIEGAGMQNSALPGGMLRIERVAVDERGRIFVPYAGQIEATGRSLDEIRSAILANIRSKLFRPQVDVQFVDRPERSVTVYGDVTTGGTVALAPGMTRLSDLLGRAGISTNTSQATRVELRRGDRVGRVSLAQLLENPGQDVALRPGDVVIVADGNEYVTVIGAAGQQGRIPIEGDDFTFVDALASARGLADEQADPKGIFLLRNNQASDLDPELAIYQLDLRDPSQLFAAGNFAMMDGDIVLISNASFAQTRKVLGAISATLTTASRSREITR